MLSDYNPEDFETALSFNDLVNKRYHSQVNVHKKPYTIVMPPPNITGILHMGHILNNTIQDVLIRYKRMDGFEACWIPGLDHASIATESKVTQWLESQNIHKKDIGRERFLEYAMEWKGEYGGIINEQLKRLGVSCDWDRERFTMDFEYSREVLQSFVDLFNEGLIYKGKRLVNWCPVSKSAISDEEVEYREEDGFLWFFSYPIKDSQESITIATTRPETIFGDTAVMVNPNDGRYKDLIGKIVILPFMNREIPIIADTYVDEEFGTGAVKVTPAHDINDYEVGLKHNLDMISVMTEDAKINHQAPLLFQGLDRFEARTAVVSQMQKLGLLVDTKTHRHRIGYSQRGNVPIELMLSEQWFMSMKDLAIEAKKVVEGNEIQFYPNHWKKTYFYWLDNIKDWCISRQLWWGHRIPVYTCLKCQYQEASVTHVELCPKCNSFFQQEESVLDTWASSWLWSYAVHKTEEEKLYYHPTDTLVTGPDIIFFWVARMIMAAKHFRKEIPFKNVYFTGIIRDNFGRKMSKSLGNSPDPLDIIKKYGADALRFSIIRLAPLGNDILYAEDQVDLGKKFANKIWNAARFILINANYRNFDTHSFIDENLENYIFDDFDKSLLTSFNDTVKNIRDYFHRFQINDVAKEIYDFVWGDFCDSYVETSKVILQSADDCTYIQKMKVILLIFKRILKLLHPIMPFITEKLFQEIFNESELLFKPYPIFNEQEVFLDSHRKVQRFKHVLYLIREMYAQNHVPQNVMSKITIAVIPDLKDFFERNSMVLQKNGRISELHIVEFGRPVNVGEAMSSEFDLQIFMDLSDIINKDQEIDRLEKEKARLLKHKESIHSKLNNAQFIEKAPAVVIEKERTKLKEMEIELDQILKALAMWQ